VRELGGITWTELIVGDVLEKLKELADESINLMMTSPYFHHFSNYIAENQIGLEPSAE
jgi:DNA modification methylase